MLEEYIKDAIDDEMKDYLTTETYKQQGEEIEKLLYSLRSELTPDQVSTLNSLVNVLGQQHSDFASAAYLRGVVSGIALKNKGYHFDLAYSSVLKRAEDTLDFILKEMGEENIPIKRSWKLNERHYGALQGLNKDETRKKYGDEQVLLWRRSTDVRPPELDENDERYPGNDPKYTDLTKDELPKTENLIDTIKRVTEYWKSDIEPDIKNGKNVIIVAHGNSLRGLMKYLDNISDEDVIKLEIQTGNPICYELDDNLKPIKHYYVKN